MRRCMILFGRGWVCVLRGNISRSTGAVSGVYDRWVCRLHTRSAGMAYTEGTVEFGIISQYLKFRYLVT